MSVVESLENAINDAVVAAGGGISFDAANAILTSHGVVGGGFTVVHEGLGLDGLNLQSNFVTELIHDDETVTGIKIHQSVDDFF